MATLGGNPNEASLGIILLCLVITGLGLPFPEIMFIAAAGVVSERSGLSVAFPIVSCSIAVLLGDLALFYLARYLGPAAVRRRPLRWVLPPKIRPRIDALFARHGSMAIFVARHLAGVRAATYALAGMHRMPLAQFVIWDVLAILVSVPVFASLGFYFSTRVDELEEHIQHAHGVIAAVVGVCVLGYLAHYWLRKRRERANEARGGADGGDA
jgi:membrane protein DedA with SNARE-associated domain